MSFDLGQTFYLDKRSVENSQAAIITSVELYFSAKPTSNKTDSGISEPGVVVSLCATKEDGSPRLDDFVTQQYTARVEYSNINVDTTGATSTKFTFTEPIAIATDRSYAFLIKFDGSDKGFRLFGNKAGTIALNTSSVTQVSSGTVDGNAYRITNGFTLTPLTDTDLTFKINIAKFTTLSETYQFRNRAYEIMKVASVNGNFKGGEEVIQERSSLTGTINVSSATKEVTGTGTSFTSTVTVNDKIIITDGTAGNTNIRVVNTVTNATHLVLDQYPSFSNTSASYYKTVIGNLFVYNSISDEMILQDSTANSTLYLTTSTTLRGIDSGATATISEIKNANVNAVVPSFAVREPPGTSSSITLNFANTGGSVSSTRKQNGILSKRSFIDQYDAIVASRTTEVTAATPFRSFVGEITFTTTNPYVSPMVQEHNLDAFIERYEINNTTTNEYLGQGAALARYISKQVNLTNDQLAEDFKIYLSAFKPINTDIKVYLRALNPEDSEAFDLKDWTEMELIQSQNLLSNPANKNDFIELAYNIPFFQSGTQVPGEFKTESANAVIVGTSGSVNTDITVGDLVHVYSPLIEDTHFVDTVTAANTTSFTVGTSVSNSSLVGTGFYVNKITRKNSGYLDIQNGNIFTYYNRSSARFNGYQTFAVKIVLLSSDGINIPYVRDLRALAVSA